MDTSTFAGGLGSRFHRTGKHARAVVVFAFLVIPLILFTAACNSSGPAAPPLTVNGRSQEQPWWEAVIVKESTTPTTVDEPAQCDYTIPGDVLFESGSAEIVDPAALDDLATKLARSARIDVHGYTDSTGDEAANMTLSQERAEAVMSQLGKSGAQLERITSYWHGESEPAADESGPDPDTARSLNRRVVVVGNCS